MSKDELFGERYCLNCEELLAEESLYCHICSQKCTDGRITVKELLKEFFDSVFNIDSRFFKTIGALGIPGKLTIQYFLGRHKSYSHPIRLFLVSGILFFSLASIVTIRYAEDGLEQFENRSIRFDAFQSQVLYRVDTLTDNLLKTFPENQLLKSAFDSLDRELDKWNDDDSISFGYANYYPPFRFEQKDLKISKVDIIEMSREELGEAYKFNDNTLGEILVTQVLRIQTDLKEFVPTVISQSIWSFLFMMLALALILKLLYVRRKIFYIEHLIFSFHFHSFAFILGSIYLMLGLFLSDFFFETISQGFIWILVGATFLYMLISMKRVYQQNWFKTFVKFCILNFSYFIVFSVFISISALFTFLVF